MTVAATQHRAFMFCRGGSKGVPDKNIREVAGKPLLVHTVETALACPSIAEIMVSTDSARIADVARAAGAGVILRPDDLATDTAAELDAWRHALDAVAPLSDLFISLPATAPLRSVGDVEAAIARHGAGGCDIVFGISEAHRNPWLNMVTRDEAGLISLVNDGARAVRRQDVPPVWDITTCVYVAGRDYVRDCETLMAGRVAGVEIPAARALDIDTPFDLHLADLLLRHPGPKEAS